MRACCHARVLALHPDGRRALFRKAGVVNDEHPASIRHTRQKTPPHRCHLPRRMGDEVLKRLIAARVVNPREHRAHRLAGAVTEQTEEVASKRATLRHVTEAVFERLQPRDESI